MATLEKTMSADQLFALGDIGPCELIRGELIYMSPTGYDHGWISGNIVCALRNFVKNRGSGRVLSSEVGFIIARNPDTVRAPDVAFVRADRDPPGGQKKFFPGPPDLAVEVLSPDDRASEVNSKVQDWLDAGTVAVLVVDPQTQTVAIHRRPHEIQILTRDDSLTIADLLPEFSLPVKEIFS
ncbi:MAG: Uma2 family endonuclease [Thermoguttaceae bacterium]